MAAIETATGCAPMKPLVSRPRVLDILSQPRRSGSAVKNVPAANRRPDDAPTAPKFVLSSWGAIIALWALPYLALLDHFGRDVAVRSEALEWMLVAVGAAGFGGVLYFAWRDTRDPAWRAAHGLSQRAGSPAPKR
jgi:hypothetical protein